MQHSLSVGSVGLLDIASDNFGCPPLDAHPKAVYPFSFLALISAPLSNKYLYEPPEHRMLIQQGKKPKLSTQTDSFALGMMIADILSGFTYFKELNADKNYSNVAYPFGLPVCSVLGAELSEKAQELLVKAPSKRVSVAVFANYSGIKSVIASPKAGDSERNSPSAGSVSSQRQPPPKKLDAFNRSSPTRAAPSPLESPSATSRPENSFRKSIKFAADV